MVSVLSILSDLTVDCGKAKPVAHKNVKKTHFCFLNAFDACVNSHNMAEPAQLICK